MDKKFRIKLMTQKEATVYAKRSKQTIHKWVKDGKIPLYHSGFRSPYKQNKAGWVSPVDIDQHKSLRKKK